MTKPPVVTGAASSVATTDTTATTGQGQSGSVPSADQAVTLQGQRHTITAGSGGSRAISRRATEFNALRDMFNQTAPTPAPPSRILTPLVRRRDTPIPGAEPAPEVTGASSSGPMDSLTHGQRRILRKWQPESRSSVRKWKPESRPIVKMTPDKDPALAGKRSVKELRTILEGALTPQVPVSPPGLPRETGYRQPVSRVVTEEILTPPQRETGYRQPVSRVVTEEILTPPLRPESPLEPFDTTEQRSMYALIEAAAIQAIHSDTRAFVPPARANAAALNNFLHELEQRGGRLPRLPFIDNLRAQVLVRDCIVAMERDGH